MTERIRAVYRDGVFLPETPCNYPENFEVELLIQGTTSRGPCVIDSEQRLRILRQVTERMQNNPLPSDAPRFNRDELHGRR